MEFALILNFERQTWPLLRLRKPDAEAFYWRRVRPWAGRLSESELEEAVNALLQNGRPMVAIDSISSAIHGHKKPSWKIVADAVDLASSSPGNPADGGFNTMSVWELGEAMKYLQADPTADQNRLAALEWRLLPLARHNHFEPKILHSELARNPGFFAEVISAVYRAKGQPRDENPDQAKQNLAEAGHSLLESWPGIPAENPTGQLMPIFYRVGLLKHARFARSMGESKCAIRRLANSSRMTRPTRMARGHAKLCGTFLKQSHRMRWCEDLI